MDHYAWVQIGIGIFFFLCVLMNVGFAAYIGTKGKDPVQGLIWIGVAFFFLIQSIGFLLVLDWTLADWIKSVVDGIMNPVSYFFLAVFGFGLFYFFRKFFTHPIVAWALLNISFVGFGWAMTDSNFRAIIAKPDNVPITLLIYSVAFFTWLSLRLAVINDERMVKGEPPVEKSKDTKVLVWPDLVYTELIAMVICTFVLVIWAVLLKAPLEQPASNSRIPNPSKAPWYFLGLQEMLVYFDPWMAGVVLPTFIIVGLIAMPYIDFNQKGNGYFTFEQRKFAILTWNFGFIVLWVVLIVLGTFLRGPNWNFFGPFEYWDPHKTVPLTNVMLSDYFWLYGLGQSMEGMHWAVREAPGIILTLAYFILIPPVLAKTLFRSFYIKMGFFRYFTMITILQFMALLPIKMLLRWTINLKYIIYIPEYFFNF